MEDNESSEKKQEGWDLIGLGKMAQAIPEDVYKMTASSALKIIEEILMPITQTTTGLGLCIRQKFQNMADVEKALCAHAIQNAVQKAKSKNKVLSPPPHVKSFVRSIEEAARETDPLLHEMWTNLIATQISNDFSHPHFIEVLQHFSREEAKVLISLYGKPPREEHGGGFISYSYDSFDYWIRGGGDKMKEWSYSCALLCEFKFASVLVPKKETDNDRVVILYRTTIGDTFLQAVGHK